MKILIKILDSPIEYFNECQNQNRKTISLCLAYLLAMTSFVLLLSLISSGGIEFESHSIKENLWTLLYFFLAIISLCIAIIFTAFFFKKLKTYSERGLIYWLTIGPIIGMALGIISGSIGIIIGICWGMFVGIFVGIINEKQK